ncbi:MAG: hypothetical protein IKP36_04960 [Bacteroidaceae bacterium]|nr:hypothetical protein [Bacteroidaceae bacterium]
MSRRYKWFFTEEWDEGGVIHLTKYGKRKVSEINETRFQMERYSPYDYCNLVECNSEEQYDSYLKCRIEDRNPSNRYEINDNEQEET